MQKPSSAPAAPVRQRCTRCHGSGRTPCEFCGGRGEVAGGRDQRGAPTYVRCNGCFGVKTMRCRNCGGAGMR